jgi:hypothetical protein
MVLRISQLVSDASHDGAPTPNLLQAVQQHSGPPSDEFKIFSIPTFAFFSETMTLPNLLMNELCTFIPSFPPFFLSRRFFWDFFGLPTGKGLF